jgi:hypothetical protein
MSLTVLRRVWSVMKIKIKVNTWSEKFRESLMVNRREEVEILIQHFEMLVSRVGENLRVFQAHFSLRKLQFLF